MIPQAATAMCCLWPRGCAEDGALTLRRDPRLRAFPHCKTLSLSSKHKLSARFDDLEQEAKKIQKAQRRSRWTSSRPEASELGCPRVLSDRESTTKRSRWKHSPAPLISNIFLLASFFSRTCYGRTIPCTGIIFSCSPSISHRTPISFFATSLFHCCRDFLPDYLFNDSVFSYERCCYMYL